MYLAERSRILPAALSKLRDSLSDVHSGLLIAPVNRSVTDLLEQIPRDIVPDMPDRIIAATALQLGVPLVTRDRRLRSAGETRQAASLREQSGTSAACFRRVALKRVPSKDAGAEARKLLEQVTARLKVVP